MKATHFSSRIPVQRLELASLPSSNVISIEKGEGLEDLSETSDAAPEEESVPGLVESVDASNELQNQQAKLGTNEDLYSTDEVVKLCDGINRQNRMAKVRYSVVILVKETSTNELTCLVACVVLFVRMPKFISITLFQRKQ